jgi:hypothetical protein
MAALKSDTRVEHSFSGRFHFSIDQLPSGPFDVRAGIKRTNDISVAQFTKAIGRRVDHMIPNDYSLVSMSHEQGQPAVRLKPQSPFAIGVKDMLSADLGAKLFPKPKRGLFSFRSK